MLHVYEMVKVKYLHYRHKERICAALCAHDVDVNAGFDLPGGERLRGSTPAEKTRPQLENISKQEAQLPQRNSASAAHMEGGVGLDPSAHTPAAPSGYTYVYGRIRNPQQTYVKHAVN